MELEVVTPEITASLKILSLPYRRNGVEKSRSSKTNETEPNIFFLFV